MRIKVTGVYEKRIYCEIKYDDGKIVSVNGLEQLKEEIKESEEEIVWDNPEVLEEISGLAALILNLGRKKCQKKK